MATVNKNKVLKLRQFNSCYGNAWRDIFTYETNSSGVFVDSDKTTAVASGDVVRLGVLPAGLQLQDALLIISTAFTAATTAKIGFLYVDGVDSAAVPQNDTFFFLSTTSTASQARTPANNLTVRPVVLPKDAYLVLTRGGATDAQAGALDIIVRGLLQGVG